MVQEGLRRKCQDDLLFYVNAFVWQFNPRERGEEVGPFLTWDFQEEAMRVMLRCIEEGEDLVIEKSREMGASWMMLLVFEWLWHFHPWQKFLLISRNEKAVEDEDPDSLFWKLDHVHRYLPGWLMPRKMRRRKLFFGNDELHSTITGQASTGKAGVGGRATAMGIDEFSQIAEDYEVLHRTSDTTSCRIFNFTHLGLDTAAYELTDPNSAVGAFVKRLNLHWTRHPHKRRGLYRVEGNKVEVLDKSYVYPEGFEFVMSGEPSGGPCPGLRSPWYDRQCKRKGSARAVAMDLDINPTGSVAQFFDAIIIRQLIEVYCVAPVWEGHVGYDRDTGQPTELIRGAKGPLRLWINPDKDGKLPKGIYTIGGDISTGCGQTNSCLSIINARTGEKVGEFTTARIDAKALAPVATALGRLLRDERGEEAKLCWEFPGPGLAFGATVMELGYRNVYYRTNELLPFARKPSDVPGWGSTGNNKRLLLEDYREALFSRKVVNRSKEAMEECLKFKYNQSGHVVHGSEDTNDPTGALVNHGDRVIADALAWKMAKEMDRDVRQQGEERVTVGSLAWRRDIHEARLQEAEAWR